MTNNTTTNVINLESFRQVCAEIDDTSDWLNEVGERESIFEKMNGNDPRVGSLVEERKDRDRKSVV